MRYVYANTTNSASLRFGTAAKQAHMLKSRRRAELEVVKHSPGASVAGVGIAVGHRCVGRRWRPLVAVEGTLLHRWPEKPYNYDL